MNFLKTSSFIVLLKKTINSLFIRKNEKQSLFFKGENAVLAIQNFNDFPSSQFSIILHFKPKRNLNDTNSIIQIKGIDEYQITFSLKVENIKNYFLLIKVIFLFLNE